MSVKIDRAVAFRALAIAAMFGCLVLALEQLLVRNSVLVDAGYVWRRGDLGWLCAAAALLAQCSHDLATRRGMGGRQAALLSAGELLALLVALKVLEAARLGRGPLQWSDGTALGLLTMGTIIAALLVCWAWLTSTWVARDFNRLDLDPGSDFAPETPVDRLFKSFYIGGVLLFLMTGLARLDMSQLLASDRPSVPGLIANVLVYFLLGLAMLGQVRLARLRHVWSRERVIVDRGLTVRWALYSVQFFGLAALAALLVSSIWSGWPFGALELSVAPGRRPPVVASRIYLPATIYDLMPAGLPAQTSSFPLLETFMLGAGLMVVWALWLISDELGPVGKVPLLGRALRALAVALALAVGWLEQAARWLERVVPGLRALLALLRRLLRRAGATVERYLPRTVPLDLATLVAGPQRLLRRRGSSPRDRVIFYYLSLVQRGEKSGVPRRPSETPNEYRAALDPLVGPAGEDLAELTQAFLEARYSRRPIAQPDADRVRSRLQRLKLRLLAARPAGARDAE